MKQKGLWSCLLLFMLALAVYLPAAAKNASDKAAETIVQVVEASGAQVQDIQLRAAAGMKKVHTSNDLVALASVWRKRLSIADQGQWTWENGLTVWEAQAGSAGAALSLRVVGVPTSDGFDTHLVVKIEGKRTHLQDVVKLRQLVVEAFKQATIIPQISTCIRGIYSDTLSDDQQEGKVFGILRSLRAREVERLQDDTVLSVSAYTEQWLPFLTTDDHKMNVQVATHLDPQTKWTRITVGTPIITAEY